MEVGINLRRVWILKFIVNRLEKCYGKPPINMAAVKKWILITQAGSVISRHIHIFVLIQWSILKKMMCQICTITCNMPCAIFDWHLDSQATFTNRAESHYLLSTSLCYPSLPYNVNMYLFVSYIIRHGLNGGHFF